MNTMYSSLRAAKIGFPVEEKQKIIQKTNSYFGTVYVAMFLAQKHNNTMFKQQRTKTPDKNQ